MDNWHLYILQCRDGKLYTGISNDVQRRVAEHNKGKGCRFTKSRYPVVLLYQEHCGTNSCAQRREQQVKRLTRQEKLRLIEGKLKFHAGPVLPVDIAIKTGSKFAKQISAP